MCEDSEEGVGLGGVGRELVSFLVFRFVCFWFGGGNRLERERREFEPVPVSSAAGRLREQDRGGGAATNGLITYQLSDHPTSPRQSSDRQDKEDKEDKARQGKQASKLTSSWWYSEDRPRPGKGQGQGQGTGTGTMQHQAQAQGQASSFKLKLECA